MITIKEIFEDIEKNGGFTPSRRVRDIATMYPDKVAFRDKDLVYGMKALMKLFGTKHNMLVMH